MDRTTTKFRVHIRRVALGVFASVAVLAVSVANPSSAQVTEPPHGQTESANIDVVDFLAQFGVVLPQAVAAQFAALTEQDQQQLLLSLGVDPLLLQSDIDNRPMPLVAELLRVLDPDAPRPEIASDEEYARGVVDRAAFAVIADLQRDYSSRLGFPRWDDTSDGGRVLMIPIVGASQQEVIQIQRTVLPEDTPVRVERTDISYQDLRKLKDEVNASIRTATGNQLTDWSIGIDRKEKKVTIRADLGLARNQEILTGIDIAAIARAAGDSFAATEIPARRRSGSELVSFANATMEPPEVDFRESENIRGREWIIPDIGGACTTNFLWKNGSSYRMGTAGHCSTTGAGVGQRAYRSFDHLTLAGSNNGDIGRVTHNGWTNNTRSDYALMTMPAAATTTNRVMTTATTWRTVTRVSDLSNLSGNFSFCHVGLGLKATHGLDKSCGIITESNIDYTHTLSTGEELTVYGLYCTDAEHAGGDSGGPHYLEVVDDAYAVGIHHGPAGTGDSCFTTVQAAKARSGYSVVLN